MLHEMHSRRVCDFITRLHISDVSEYARKSVFAEATITPDPIACVAISVGEYPQDVCLLCETRFLPDDRPARRATRFNPAVRHADPCVIGARTEPGIIFKQCGTVN